MKRQYMAIVTALAKSLGILVAIYVCCRYLGEFSPKQSGVLTLLGWIGFELYGRTRALQRPPQSFSPFCVSIRPNWHCMLMDFKLIGSEDEWKRLCEVMGKVPAGEYSVFRSGILFTVVAAPSDDGLPPGLIYSDNHKSFVSKADFSESVVELERGQRSRGEHPYFKHPYWGNLPELYFKWGSDGYELGLEVQDGWWKDLCETGRIGELAKVKAHRDHLCGTTRVVIATLPYSEFGIYYGTIDYEGMRAQQEGGDKVLEALGWKRAVEGDSEIQDPWWRIDHKYFAVAHREL